MTSHNPFLTSWLVSNPANYSSGILINLIHLLIQCYPLSLLQVVINYSSRKVKVKCQDDVAGIVENLAKRNFRTAANLIAQNSEVMEEVQDRVLEEVEVECRTLCNQQNHFMLWRATATDLQSFSFHDLHADLKRLSPFLFSVLAKISKDSLPHICAAASIALRGRENRLSALAYFINNRFHLFVQAI